MSGVVLKSSGTGFGWCINQYDGCSHGCLYCYGMTKRRKSYQDWIKASLRKVDVLGTLRKDIQKLKNNDLIGQVKDVFLGSITDPYQPLERRHKITRAIIKILRENDLPFTLLTKSNLILRDIDLLSDYELCRAGVTLTSSNEKIRAVLEPGAMSYVERVKTLVKLKESGISTYVSCEPIMPIKEANILDIVLELSDIVDLFEFGLWNKYRYKHLDPYFYENYSDEYYYSVFEELIFFCEGLGINYCIASHSKKFVEDNGLPFKPYPLVKNSLDMD